jgi:two-component system, response regulator YesN
MRRIKYFLYKKEIERVETIKAYIHANPDKDLSINFIAGLFHISRTTLQRHFFAHEKTSIHAFIFECRMARAQKLLHSGDLSIHEISHAVGFGSFSAFTHGFHQFFGYNPIDFRKKSN